MDECCETKLVQIGYGYCRSHGFRGLGAYEVCVNCWTLHYWEDDRECNSDGEIIHNTRVKEHLNIE